MAVEDTATGAGSTARPYRFEGILAAATRFDAAAERTGAPAPPPPAGSGPASFRTGVGTVPRGPVVDPTPPGAQPDEGPRHRRVVVVGAAAVLVVLAGAFGVAGVVGSDGDPGAVRAPGVAAGSGAVPGPGEAPGSGSSPGSGAETGPGAVPGPGEAPGSGSSPGSGAGTGPGAVADACVPVALEQGLGAVDGVAYSVVEQRCDGTFAYVRMDPLVAGPGTVFVAARHQDGAWQALHHAWSQDCVAVLEQSDAAFPPELCEALG